MIFWVWVSNASCCFNKLLAHHSSPLKVLRIVHINYLSGSLSSSMSGKYFINSGLSFTSSQTCLTPSSLYLGIGKSVFWFCFRAYFIKHLCLPSILTSFLFTNISFKKNVGNLSKGGKYNPTKTNWSQDYLL